MVVKKIKRLTEKHKKKISKAMKGKPAWNKGLTKEKYPRLSGGPKKGSGKGRKLSKKIKKKISETNKRKHFSPQSEFQKGNKNPKWQGGISFEPYLINWTETLRQRIRERDCYTCQLCGKLQNDKVFNVHHIDYSKKNCNPDNLITLCRQCHSKTNINREYWQMYFGGRIFDRNRCMDLLTESIPISERGAIHIASTKKKEEES